MAQFIGKCIFISFCVLAVGCKAKKQEEPQQKERDLSKLQLLTEEENVNYDDEKQMHTKMPDEKLDPIVCSQVQLVTNPDYQSTTSDFFELMRHTIAHDTLTLFLKYGGGCKQTQLAIHWNRTIAESYPPQVYIKPVFTDSDPCRALIQRPFCFALQQLDLAPPYILVLDLPEGKSKKIKIE